MANPDGAAFCLTCGVDFEKRAATTGKPAHSRCPNCKAKNPPEATFCSLCGKDLEPQVAQPVSSPAEAAPAPVVDSLPPPLVPPGMRDLQKEALDQALPVSQVLELAKQDIAENRRESAAKLLLDAMHRQPSEKRLRDLFRKNFDHKELRHLNLQVAPVPIWEELGDTLLYPLQRNEWLSLLVGGVVLGIMSFLAAHAFFWGFAIMVFVLSYAANVMARHLKWASVGRPGHPGIIEFRFGDLAYVGMSIVATMWPMIVLLIFLLVRFVQYGFGISPIGLVLVIGFILASYLVGCFLQPMAMLVAMLFNTWSMAFSYSFILRAMRVVWKDYLFASVLLFLTGLLQGFSRGLVPQLPGGAFSPTHFLTPMVAWVFTLYNLTLLGHVLGRIYYFNERRLAWFDDNSVQPKTSPLGFMILAACVALMFGLAYMTLQPTGEGSASWTETAAEGSDTCQAAAMALSKGGSDQAIALANQALTENPDLAGAYIVRAQAYFRTGNPKLALSDMDQAINMAPRYAPAYQMRALMLGQLGKAKDAEEDLQASKRLLEGMSFSEMQQNIRPVWKVYAEAAPETEE